MDSYKILIVDDEERMRKLLRDVLVKAGYRVAEAADGEAALNTYYNDNGIDLIILDVMMPKMDGWEVLEAIRKISKVPVIMLTARAEERDELKGFSLGVDEYITKPFSPRILVARVEALLRRTKDQKPEILNIGGIEINKAAHTVTYCRKHYSPVLRFRFLVKGTVLIDLLNIPPVSTYRMEHIHPPRAQSSSPPEWNSNSTSESLNLLPSLRQTGLYSGICFPS